MTSESSCGPSVPALEYANRLTALVLGTDAYYRSVGAARGRARDGLGLPVGLVAMHWSDVAPEPVDSWESANVQLLALGEEAAQLPGAYERDWYGELCASLRLLFRWYQGEALSLEEIVEHGHRSRFNAPSERLLERLCLTRDEAVRAAGYESYADYLDENALQADEVVPRLTALVAEAAMLTKASLPELRMPTEALHVRAVGGTPYVAYFNYLERSLTVNTEVVHTAADLKHLAGHEAYPGHYAHFHHRHELVTARRMPSDGALIVTNSASTALVEGIAESGLDLLGWRGAAEDRVAWAAIRVQWYCSLIAAYGMASGDMAAQDAQRLLARCCGQNDAWLDGRMRFISDLRRAAFIFAYWNGSRAVESWWARVPPPDRGRAIRHLFDRTHTPRTLKAHWSRQSGGGHAGR